MPVDQVVTNQRTGEVEPRTAGRRTSSRIDPLGILRRVEVFKGDAGWDTTEGAAEPMGVINRATFGQIGAPG